MGLSPLARFCLLEGMVLDLHQGELRAGGVVIVASGDFEPPAWFRSSQLTCAENLSLCQTQCWALGTRALPSAHSRGCALSSALPLA